ncbi:MAG: chorismate mutase [Deltaproteobacteria bacterium]|nr:chorismate mutase [Deltaproteobacteria bacterium]
MSDELGQLRERIGDVDRRIVEALAERRRVVAAVATAKADKTGHLRDLAREEEHLGRLVALARDAGVDAWFVTRLFRDIFDDSLRYQQELLSRGDESGAGDVQTVAFQGTEGSYSHLACRRYFSSRSEDVVFRGLPTFAELLDAVRGGVARYGLLPIENTTAGSIIQAYDLLATSDLAVIGEEIQPVEHCLIALSDVPLSHIRRIYSQAPALAQCGRFLGTLQHCQVEAFTDTAMSVKKIIADQDDTQAAIASEEAARLYGLHVIKRHIADQRENYTRFLVVAREPVTYDLRIPCKTSIIFATGHQEGALLECLGVLARHHLNLTKLESRPRPHVPWEYLFYVDFEGNVADPDVREAMEALAAHTRLLKVLGSYPARNVRDNRPAEPRPPRPPAPARAGSSPGATPGLIAALEKKPYRLASRAHRREDSVVAVGAVRFGGPRAVVCAGPPRIVSREQVMACARALRHLGADLLTGGAFAPRSAAGAEGLGMAGVELLAEAGRATGLPVLAEVVHPAEVEAVARHATMLLVPARQMDAFPLLEAVGRSDRPVILERGPAATIDEWLSAAEQILGQGNQQLVLCDPGIRTFETATGLSLDLSAIPVLRERTHLPVLVAPARAAGAARRVPALAEAALAAGAQGLMLAIDEPASGESLDADALGQLLGRLQPWRP